LHKSGFGIDLNFTNEGGDVNLRKCLLGLIIVASMPAFSADWVATYKNDEMRGTATKYLQTNSDNTTDFDFPYNGGSTLSIVLRSQNTKLKDGQTADNLKPREAMIIISKGQFNCAAYDGCSIAVKFDNDNIKHYEMSGASDNSTDVLFINDAPSFIKNISTHKKLIIEADFFQAGARQFKFDLAGYKDPKKG